MKQNFLKSFTKGNPICTFNFNHGGGPVGIELAGEVKALYPEKQIVVIISSSWLISTLNNENIHEKLSSVIETAGNILLIFQDKVLLLENVQTAILLEEEFLLAT